MQSSSESSQPPRDERESVPVSTNVVVSADELKALLEEEAVERAIAQTLQKSIAQR